MATKTKTTKEQAVGTRKKRPAKSMPVGTRVDAVITAPSLEYAHVLTHAIETFGSKARADAWLNKPNRLFRYKTPFQVLITDAAGVEEELVRIDHGIYA